MSALALPFGARRGWDGAALLAAVAPDRSRPTTVTVQLPAAPPTGPYWREVYPKAPPDLRLDAGGWCRLCDGQLGLSTTGWFCDAPSCRAAWDFQGRHGWWRSGGAR